MTFLSAMRAIALLVAWSLGLAWTAVLAGPANAGSEPLVLREQVRVHGDLVTLGDLFDNPGIAHSIAVFQSPDLGTEGFVAARRVQQAAARHGLVWANLGDIEQIVVRRPAREIGLDEITSLVRQRLRPIMGVADLAALDVALTGNPKPILLDARITAPLVVKSIDYAAHADSFSAEVGFEEAGEERQGYRVQGRVFESVETVVPARTIERGATIAAEDVRTVRVQKSQVPPGRVTQLAEIVGMAARRHLAEGRQVRKADIEEPKIVRRNDLVTILYDVGRLTLQAQGRALADAAKGDTISVRNTRSNQTIQGVVRSPDTVVVAATGGRIVKRNAPRQRKTAAAAHTVR